MESEIIQENHYYPGGLEMEGEWTNATMPLQPYTYSNKELNNDYGLGLLDFGNRCQDPTIIRFTSVDRFSEKYYSHSTYNFTLNNPINIVDIKGDSVALIIGKPYVDGNGTEHKYGHVALRVFNSKEGYDNVYDFGRYGRTWGLIGSKGEGVLNVYNNSKSYLKYQQSFRNSVEYVLPTSVEEDKKILNHYDELVSGGNTHGSGAVPGGGGKAHKLENDYDVFSNNCCTISGEGLKQVGNEAVGSEYDPRSLLNNIESNYKQLGFTKRTEYLKGGNVKTTYEKKVQHSSTGSGIKDHYHY